mmetsp:Transcript_3442/g.4669  ORF Transcript_3442/g.4669 Transcript_3442/m.4669 type:complete len:109 (+) Transcript_3442:994-1320(+)
MSFFHQRTCFVARRAKDAFKLKDHAEYFKQKFPYGTLKKIFVQCTMMYIEEAYSKNNYTTLSPEFWALLRLMIYHLTFYLFGSENPSEKHPLVTINSLIFLYGFLGKS